MTQPVLKNPRLCDFPPCSNLRSKEPGMALCAEHAAWAKFMQYMFSRTIINQVPMINLLAAAQQLLANFPALVAQAQTENAIKATKAKLTDTQGRTLIKG